MQETPDIVTPKPPSRMRLWLAGGVIIGLFGLLAIGKFSGWIDPLLIAQDLQVRIVTFADSPWGVPALILAFCVCAFIAVPQFALIGMSTVAFGPIAGGVLAWIATMCSGTLTYWLGRFFGQGLLKRFSGPRTTKFTAFVAKNALVASAIVRNAPAGPFLFVNMMFGAVRAPYAYFMAGMALGIIPKILLIVFGVQAVMAVLKGNIILAFSAGLAALIVFVGGWYYVRQKRRKGEIIALDAESPVDSANA
jgi:uncharacterized membrane protein YdjX (TVP38/TMEM64 family)